jgi:hypothetical protein
MNDLNNLLATFPGLQHSPLAIGLFNAALIVYHILTHNRKPRGTTAKTRWTTSKTRPVNQPFMPQDLYTPWTAAWFEVKNKAIKEYTKGKVLPDLINFKTDLKHARSDLKNLVDAFPTHPDSDALRERIFKVDQILNALDLAGKLGPTT